MCVLADNKTRGSVLTARRVGSDVYELMSLDDGGYGIAVNGQAIACFHWKSDELDDCMRTLGRLAVKDD